MSAELGSIDVCCDAPPYGIVRASRETGIRSPEDARWLRMSTFRGRLPGLVARVWSALRGSGRRARTTCTCGAPLPTLRRVVFVATTGLEVTYLLAPCRRCRTVFWEPA